MKKAILILLSLIAVMVISAGVSLATYHYEQSKQGMFVKDTTVGVDVTISEATFSNVDEVIGLRSEMIRDRFIDSMFTKGIPQNVFQNVTQVVIGRRGRCTKKDIVEEFLRNGDSVYKFIAPPPSTTQPEKKDSVPKMTKKDTVINGEEYTIYKKE